MKLDEKQQFIRWFSRPQCWRGNVSMSSLYSNCESVYRRTLPEVVLSGSLHQPASNSTDISRPRIGCFGCTVWSSLSVCHLLCVAIVSHWTRWGRRRWKGVKGVQGAETLSRPIPTVTVNFEEIVFSDRSEHHLAPLCRSMRFCRRLQMWVTYLLSAIASYTALQSACA